MINQSQYINLINTKVEPNQCSCIKNFKTLSNLIHLPSYHFTDTNSLREENVIHRNLSKNESKWNEEIERVTLLRRCSSGIPETMPISPGLTSTNASAENDLEREHKAVRRERPWLHIRCRGWAIFKSKGSSVAWLFFFLPCKWSFLKQKYLIVFHKITVLPLLFCICIRFLS